MLISAQDIPLEQLGQWLDEATRAAIREPNAMTLATSGADGAPHARVVLLKGLDARGLVFFTNYESAKGRELEENRRASAVFFWRDLERQVRVEGSVEKVTRDETEAYFRTRPRESQVGAWASPQSRVIESREILERRVVETNASFGEDAIPAPPFWGGYRLVPTVIEFWAGRPNRLHDRERFTRDAGGWRVEQLAP